MTPMCVFLPLMAKKQIKSKTVEMGGVQKDVVRATFRLHGAELRQIREVQEMLSLNSELDAARYLMQRGLEVMSATLASRRSSTRVADAVSVDKIAEEVFAKLGVSAETFKEKE